MKKRMLSFLLAALMIAGMLPVTAVAATPDYTLVLSGGKVYKNSTAGQVLTDTGITGSGTTYTFKNVDFETTAATAVEIEDEYATIVLSGDSTIVGGDLEEGDVECVEAENLIIQGTGSLTICAGCTNSVWSASYGLYADGTLTVRGGEITANAGGSPAGSIGVYADKDMLVEGGVLTGFGGAAGAASIGVGCLTDLTITGGSVTAKCNEGPQGVGLMAWNILIEGGSLDAYATWAEVGYGIALGGPDATGITITGGRVNLFASTFASVGLDSQGAHPFAPVTVNSQGRNMMMVMAGGDPEGYDSDWVTGWKGDGTDDVSAYRFMNLSPREQKPLDAPTARISADSATGKPKISWNKVDGAVKYRVYRSTSKTGTYTFLKTTVSARSYIDVTAKAGVNYYYKVKALAEDSLEDSGWSNIVNRVCDLAKPEVTLTVKTATGKPVVKWKTVEGAAKYRVYRATGKDGTYKLIYTAVSARSYTDTTAKAGTNYYYKVKAVHTKSAADSAYSEIVNRVCDLAKPEVSIALTSGGSPKLTWKAISGAEKYYVYRSGSKDGTYEKVKTTVTATSFTDKDAAAGKTWYYKVKAIHEVSAAASAYSTVKSIKAK